MLQLFERHAYNISGDLQLFRLTFWTIADNERTVIDVNKSASQSLSLQIPCRLWWWRSEAVDERRLKDHVDNFEFYLVHLWSSLIADNFTDGYDVLH